MYLTVVTSQETLSSIRLYYIKGRCIKGTFRYLDRASVDHLLKQVLNL